MYTAAGTRKRAKEETPPTIHDIAGPLCFSGDIVAPGVTLPGIVVPGDIVVLAEAGGNTLSIATSHCSRRRPAVYGYSSDPLLGRVMLPAGDGGDGHRGGDREEGGAGGGAEGGDTGLIFTMLCKPASIEETLHYWG